jgi:hypothetical protein
LIFRFKGNGNERIVDNCPQWRTPCGILCSYPQSPAGTSGLVPAGVVFKGALKTLLHRPFPCPSLRAREGWGMDSHGRGTTTSPMGIRYPIPIPTVICGVVWRGEVPPSRRSRIGKEEVPPPMTRSNLDRWEDCGDGVQGCPLPHLLLWQKGSVLPFYPKG